MIDTRQYHIFVCNFTIMKKLYIAIVVALFVLCTMLLTTNFSITFYIPLHDSYNLEDIAICKQYMMQWKLHCDSFQIVSYIPISLVDQNGNATQTFLRYCETDEIFASNFLYMQDYYLYTVEDIPDNVVIVPFHYNSGSTTHYTVILDEEKCDVNIDYYNVINTSSFDRYCFSNRVTFQNLYALYQHKTHGANQSSCIEVTVSQTNRLQFFLFWFDIANNIGSFNITSKNPYALDS